MRNRINFSSLYFVISSITHTLIYFHARKAFISKLRNTFFPDQNGNDPSSVVTMECVNSGVETLKGRGNGETLRKLIAVIPINLLDAPGTREQETKEARGRETYIAVVKQQSCITIIRQGIQKRCDTIWQ